MYALQIQYIVETIHLETVLWTVWLAHPNWIILCMYVYVIELYIYICLFTYSMYIYICIVCNLFLETNTVYILYIYVFLLFIFMCNRMYQEFINIMCIHQVWVHHPKYAACTSLVPDIAGNRWYRHNTESHLLGFQGNGCTTRRSISLGMQIVNLPFLRRKS